MRKDARLHFDGNRYCVHPRYCGFHLTVRADSQSLAIDLVCFVACSDDLSWIAHQDACHMRQDQVVEPRRLGPLLERHMQRPALTLDEVNDSH